MNNENDIHKSSFKLLISLTLAGVIPFMLAAVLLHTKWVQQSTALEFLFAYAAVILSFLGGIQWGVGVSRLEAKACYYPRIFTLSIIPSLAAWLLLLPHRPKLQLIGLMFCYIMVVIVDSVLNKKGMIPRWFLILRWCITLLVMTLLLFCYSAL